MRPSLRPVLRALGRARGFTAAAVLCIALGIGANTAIFSAVSAVLLRPVATPEVGRLAVVHDDMVALDLRAMEMAPPEVLDLARRRDLFASVAGFATRGFVLTRDDGSERVRGVRTLGDWWALWRVRPALGRLYGADEARDGRHRVAVLSHAFWQERFGGDAGVVGRSVKLNDQDYEVVGVLPAEFRYPRDARVYVPLPIASDSALAAMRVSQMLTTVARLRPGRTLAQVDAALQGEARAWRDRYPEVGYAKWGHRLTTESFVAWDAGQLRGTLYVLLGAVALVLLVACANVASLQLVRATARARELTVRAALGAGRGTLAGQLLAESAVLAVAGGALGLGSGWALARLIAWRAPAELLALQELRLDGPVLLGTLAATVLVLLVAGTLPALRASRVQLAPTLRDATRGGTSGAATHRVLHGAVVAQVALALVLLLGAGVMVRSLARLLDVDTGFRPARVTTARVALPFARYAKPGAAAAFYGQVLERLRAAPGVVAAGLTEAVPLTGEPNSSPFTIAGRDTAGQPAPPHAAMIFADAGYFRAMGIPLRRGRAFGAEEATRPAEGTMSVLIDETLARRWFPNEDPIGRHVSQGPDAVIVGVVGAVRQAALGDSVRPAIYYDYRQGWGTAFSLVVRTTGDDAAAARLLRDAVGAVDPQVPVYEVASLPALLQRSIGTRRFGVAVLGGFAALSLALAVVGIYGVLTYVTAQRARELGIRAALGAGRGALTGLVLGRGARLAAAGIALGTLAYLAAGRALAEQLYGVGPRDPLTLLAGAATLGTVALLASWLPARRAARLDPAVALRAD